MTCNKKAAVLLRTLLFATSISFAQKIGTAIPEVHPRLATQLCTTSGGCVTRQNSLVTDSLAHPLHAINDPSTSCTTTPLNATLCPDAATCASNCVLEGIEYGSIGVLAKDSALTLRQYLFDGASYRSVSPRLYLLAEDDMNYEPLKLLNKELTFEVDVSQLACGMNGALYLSEMDMSGSRSDLNPAGAQYGTGYCDAQCFTTPAFINGVANLNSSGACCNEMDIWEANSRATVYTPHTCSGAGSFLCSGAECNRTEAGSGVCDKSGCGINTYALGNQRFYGPGGQVDSTRPFTVVTQFLTSDGTDAGDLVEIKRIYVQDGTVIPNTPEHDSDNNLPEDYDGVITQEYCQARNSSDFLRLGGMRGMGESLARGMVLIFSIWNSEGDFMSWLDGEGNGPCDATEGNPANIVRDTPDVSVTFANVRWGDIGSTFNVSGMVAGKALAAEEAAAASSGAVAGGAGLITAAAGWVVGLALLMGVVF